MPAGNQGERSDQPYRIGRGEDVLDIAVWRDAELSRSRRPDGFISMPRVGKSGGGEDADRAGRRRSSQASSHACRSRA